MELPNDATINLTTTLRVESEVTLNANGSTIQPDAGGAPFRLVRVNSFGDLTLNDAVLTGGNDQEYNRAGGAYAIVGNMDINRSTVAGNTGGGVGFALASGSVVDSNIINNSGNTGEGFYGAGLNVLGSTVTVSGSTISSNTNTATTEGGAGIQVSNYLGTVYTGFATSLDVINTTITANSSVSRGAGVFSYNAPGLEPVPINMTNVTLAANSSSAGVGGGLSSDGATISLSQSLVSGNSAASGGAEIDVSAGTVTVDDYNLLGLNMDSGVVGVTVGASDIVPTEAAITDILDVNLADNGGPTLTHALTNDSPAVDAVPAANCASATDQTGKTRPLDGNGDSIDDCDIGAFENEAVANPDVIYENGFEANPNPV